MTIASFNKKNLKEKTHLEITYSQYGILCALLDIELEDQRSDHGGGCGGHIRDPHLCGGERGIRVSVGVVHQGVERLVHPLPEDNRHWGSEGKM